MINLAIIGCGRIAYKHIHAAVFNQDKIRLVATCDIVKERSVQRAKEYSDIMCTHNKNITPKPYENYKDMLESEEIDLVVISTESGYHAEQGIYCINKGKHVIVEKPIALSTYDADAMIKAAEDRNVKLCVSHQNRFNAPIQKLRKALDDGRFGKLIACNARILWNRGEDYYKQAPWRGTYDLDGGCLMNQCIHNIDLLQWVMQSKIKWLNADVENFMHPYIEAEDYGSIQIKFENDTIGNIEGTTCVYPSNLEETLTVIGEKGMVSIGGLAVNKIETWKFADALDTEESVKAECNIDVDSVYGNGHTLLYNNVVEAIENDIEPYINGNEGKKALEIILAAYKSSKEGKRIHFPVDRIATIDFK